MTQTQKQTWIILVVIATLALGGFLGFKFYHKSFIEKKFLVLTMKEQNKKCPVTYSNGIRLDSVTIESGSKFEYHSTLINVEKEKLNLDSFINITHQRIFGDLTDPSLQPMKDNNITLAYLYMDKNGKLLSEFIITPDKYGKK